MLSTVFKPRPYPALVLLALILTIFGFKVMRYNEEEGEMNWAKLCFGNSEVMFDAGGKASTEHRREADLYITTDNVDAL